MQEELRKRNLYFGDIDGVLTPELGNALKRYQSRKGFAVTGTIDGETATSLRVQARPVTKEAPTPLPDVPVLRSDPAREVPQEQRIALEEKDDDSSDATLAPAPPAESPPTAPEAETERIKTLVTQYLRDSETFDIPAQTRYFAYPVTYFDHGSVDAAFVHRDVTNYVKRWPERKYVLEEPVTVGSLGTDGELRVEFPITFQVRNQKYVATGRTKNFWTLRKSGDDLKIISIREQRLRE